MSLHKHLILLMGGMTVIYMMRHGHLGIMIHWLSSSASSSFSSCSLYDLFYSPYYIIKALVVVVSSALKSSFFALAGKT